MSIRLKCVLVKITIKLEVLKNIRIVDSFAPFCHVVMMEPMHAGMIEARHLPSRVNGYRQHDVQQAPVNDGSRRKVEVCDRNQLHHHRYRTLAEIVAHRHVVAADCRISFRGVMKEMKLTVAARQNMLQVVSREKC